MAPSIKARGLQYLASKISRKSAAKPSHASSSLFVYDVLPSKSIRLLELQNPIDGSGAMILCLRTYKLKDAPPFNALSYVWGQSTGVREILCINKLTPGGALIVITPNLFEALPFLKNISKMPIWVDAICINQSDDDEKARVVPTMGKIYGDAAEVLIWLGPYQDDSLLAMDVLIWIEFPESRDVMPAGMTISQLDALAGILQDGSTVHVGGAPVARGLPPRNHPFWAALPALYRREWFFRIWTFQEAMLAESARVVLGDLSVSLEVFGSFRTKMTASQLMGVSDHRTGSTPPAARIAAPDEDDEQEFVQFLHLTRTKQCLYKEDRVYGLLALAPEEIRSQTDVVYSGSKENYIQVYRSLAVRLIMSMGPAAVLQVAVSTDKPETMPSWCADWSLQTISDPFYCHRFSLDPRLDALAFWDVSITRPNDLYIRGLEIDQVREVIDQYSWEWSRHPQRQAGAAGKMSQWLDSCEKLTKETMEDSDNRNLALWETVLAHSPLHNLPGFPDSLDQALEEYRAYLTKIRDRVSQSTPYSNSRRVLSQVLAHLGQLWPGRVFFSTVSGRVGFADRNIAPGDRICLFFGCPKYYIIRPHEAACYIYRSTAYVQGLMGNVAETLGLFDSQGNLTMESETFKIC